MVHFIIGMFIGAFVGILFMALFNASSSSDRYDSKNSDSKNE